MPTSHREIVKVRLGEIDKISQVEIVKQDYQKHSRP